MENQRKAAKQQNDVERNGLRKPLMAEPEP
jgi:hypothetical protein